MQSINQGKKANGIGKKIIFVKEILLWSSFGLLTIWSLGFVLAWSVYGRETGEWVQNQSQTKESSDVPLHRG